ncbi:hypothetical protein D3C81_1460460 [compost metagenome]
MGNLSDRSCLCHSCSALQSMHLPLDGGNQVMVIHLAHPAVYVQLKLRENFLGFFNIELSHLRVVFNRRRGRRLLRMLGGGLLYIIAFRVSRFSMRNWVQIFRLMTFLRSIRFRFSMRNWSDLSDLNVLSLFRPAPQCLDNL